MQVEDPVTNGGDEERSKATRLELCEIPPRRGDDALMVDQRLSYGLANLCHETYNDPWHVICSSLLMTPASIDTVE